MKFSLQTHRSVYLALLFFCAASILAAGLTQQTWRASAAAILGQPQQDASAVIWQDQGALQRSKETPGTARAFRLSPTALTAVLTRAPREFRAPLKASQVELTLPLPSGALARFQIEESPMLEPDLAARLPEVKTYRGQGLDDPTATVRFDWTPQGFHALILSANGDFLIEPATAGDTLNYVSQNMQMQRDVILVSCGVTEADVAEATARGVYGSGNRPQAPAFSNGSTLRIYRMAVAASGEYATLYGSSNVATTQTVITSVINLVNAIFEKEMAVRFTLVNNTNIIFTNAATDPYASGANGNSASSATLNANQTTLDNNALLGSANYDIGHLFGGITGLPGGSASFSGLAQLGVVCVAGAKARGVSTMGGFTATSSFFIPGIVHEIGHQFSARHTFNGTLGNCGGGNRDSNSAYESGSGITIMSYAGNCGNDNLTSNTSSDVRFHSKSFEQMLNFMTSTATCNTTSATGNTPPTVNAGADFTIPINTPFTLTATASDPDVADAGALRYSWEQIDSGGTTFSQNGTEASYNDAADAGTTTRPIFRPFARNTSLSRTFPSLTYILNNANDPPQFNGAFETAEELPRIGRTINFRFTAHDNRANGGGITDDSVVITVNGATGPFLVTAPNTNVSWTGNTSQTVTWSLNGTNALAANVKISLSTDGGNTFPTTLLASTPNDGSESITVPNINTTTARIKVEAVGNIFFDISNANFTITTGAANTAPTFTPAAAIARQQGSSAGAAVTVGTVADAQTAAGSLIVTQIAGGTATGITVTGITNTNGTITAQVSASCTATTGTVRFQVSDGSLTGTGDLTVNVSANAAPVFGYSSPQSVTAGSALTVTPSSGPSDNGNVASIVLQSQGTYTGTISVNGTTGVVSISNAGPAGSHTIVVRATDNCGVFTDGTFTLNVAASNTAPTFTPAAALLRQQGSPAGAAVTVGTVTDSQTSAGSLTVTQIAGGTATGITVTGITNSNGTIAAQVSASCTATTGTVRFQVSDGSLTSTGDLTVNVTANTAPVLSYSSPQAVSVAGSLTVNPATGPSDNGSLASIVLQSQGTYTGTISVNNSTGIVSISNAAPIGSHTITVRATDNCGTQTNATFTLNVNNTAPTFTPAAALARQQGSAAGAAVTVGTVADATTSAGSLTVTQIAGGTATGITVTGITNTNGTITAQVSAGCTATAGTVRFQASDGSLTGTGDLQVNVTANALPTLTYANANVTAGGATTINPATGPSDNGTISTIVVQNQGTYTGTISVNISTGVVSISNAAPAGNHTITIRATDNCGAQTNASFTLSVGAACPTITVNPSNSTLPVGRAGMAYSQTFTQTGGAGTVNFSISAGALPTGLTLSNAGGLSGTPSVFGPFSFTVRATDANNCLGERAYTLTINPPCTTITVNPTTLPNSTISTAYNQPLTATGGTAPYTFAVTTGSLPTGLALASGGALTGTTTATGSFNFTVTATDNTGCTGTRSYTVIINAAGSSGLMFYPLAAPVRLLDTRSGASACSQPNAPIAGQTSRTQPGRNLCTIPANAQALTGNVTTVNSGGGFLTLYPSDATQPTVASTNYGVNEIINNVFTVGLGADGAFKIFAFNTTDVVVDVTGYYAPPGAGGLYFHPLPSPVRLLETRAGFIGCVIPGAPLVGNTESTQQAISACTGIPAAARAIVGNATTVGPQGPGFLTLFPADATRPLVASSNFNTGQVVNGPFSVGLAANGQFKIYTTATTDLVVDVLGYYSPEANDGNGPGLLFNPLPKPVRLLETRPGQPVGCFKPGVPLAGDKGITQTARGVCDGVTIPATALGVVGNATIVFPAGPGFLTLWPSMVTQPLVATSNYNAGDVGNRHFIVGLDNADGAFNIYSLATTHLVIDLSGYFAP